MAIIWWSLLGAVVFLFLYLGGITLSSRNNATSPFAGSGMGRFFNPIAFAAAAFLTAFVVGLALATTQGAFGPS